MSVKTANVTRCCACGKDHVDVVLTEFVFAAQIDGVVYRYSFFCPNNFSRVWVGEKDGRLVQPGFTAEIGGPVTLCDERLLKDMKVLANCLLVNPENAESVNIASNPQDNGDGSFSFEVIDARTGQRWRHTIQTEEV